MSNKITKAQAISFIRVLEKLNNQFDAGISISVNEDRGIRIDGHNYYDDRQVLSSAIDAEYGYDDNDKLESDLESMWNDYIDDAKEARDNPDINSCPKCGTNELLCGYPSGQGGCSSGR